MSPMTSAAINSANSPQTGEVWLILFTLNHSSLAAPLRRVSNDEDVTSNSSVYTACGLKAELPDDVTESLPEVSVVLEDLDQEFVAAIRSIDSIIDNRPTVTTSVIMASAPDDVLMSFDWQVLEANIDAGVVRFRLGFQDLLREPFSGLRFVPSAFPGLFQ